jgi:hypothetical protein
MSERDTILRLLTAVARRLRLNQTIRDVSAGLSIALLVLVGVKVVDLFSPFSGTAVISVLTIWALATAGWIVWQLRGSGTLDNAATLIDERAGAHDEIKTAFWFIRNPKESPWVDAQIQRAAKNASRMEIESLCPRVIPRPFYAVAGLIILLATLNFLPLPWNHNWLFLQAAPAFSLTSAQRGSLDRALELLKKAEALQQTDVAAKLAQIVQDLKDGTLSRDDFSRSLSELQQTLSERSLDAGRIADGLERIGKALEASPLTNAASGKVSAMDLQSAADDLRDLAKNLNPASLQETAERFQDAAEAAGKGLEQVSQAMQRTATAMRQRDVTGSQQNLEQVAREFESLQRTLDSQRLRAQASEQISGLKESIGGQRDRSTQMASAQNASNKAVGQGESMAPGQGEGKGQGEGQGEGQGQGQGQGEGEGQGQGDGQGDGQGLGDGGAGDGRGSLAAGRSGPAPGRGQPTSLEAQLDREELPVQPTRGSRPETIVEASERERSKLDYRNIPSQLSPAQKDLLNQDAIPWEQRRFVKEYFEAIRK